MTDIRTDVGVEETCVLRRDLGFVYSNAEFEWVDDAPFSHFAVDGVDFVGVDEAGFHDEESACLFRYAEFGGGLFSRSARPRGMDAPRVGANFA